MNYAYFSAKIGSTAVLFCPGTDNTFIMPLLLHVFAFVAVTGILVPTTSVFLFYIVPSVLTAIDE